MKAVAILSIGENGKYILESCNPESCKHLGCMDTKDAEIIIELACELLGDGLRDDYEEFFDALLTFADNWKKTKIK